MLQRSIPLFFIAVVAIAIVLAISADGSKSSSFQNEEEDFPSIEVLVNPEGIITPPRTVAPKLSGWLTTEQCYNQGIDAPRNPAVISEGLATILKAGPVNAPHFLFFSWNCELWVLLDYRSRGDPQEEFCAWLYMHGIPDSDIAQIHLFNYGAELYLPFCGWQETL